MSRTESPLVYGLAVLALAASAPAHAQTATPTRTDSLSKPGRTAPAHWEDALKARPLLPGRRDLTLTVSGQARWRGETVHHYNLTTLRDDYSQSRLVLSADLQAGSRTGWHGRLFAEGRDDQSYGRILPGGNRPQDADRHDWQLLYADLDYGASMLRVGRQEVSMNRDRLFGVPDWSNTRKGLDGARLQLVHGAFAVEAMDARPVIVRLNAPNRADSTTRFRTVSVGSAPGAAPLARGLPAIWQGYWYEQTLHVGTTTTRRLTTGGRTQWQWALPGARIASLEFEGAVQGGHTGAQSLRAWFWVTEAQLQWKRLRGAPTLALGLEEASGDRPDTPTRIETFAVLYPGAHQHGGYADVLGRANAREWHLISTWDPTSALSLRAAAYRFDRVRTDDGVYTKQTTLFRAASGAHTRHADDELDLTGTWKFARQWRLVFGGAVVSPGAFLRDTPGGAHTETWAFTGTTFIF